MEQYKNEINNFFGVKGWLAIFIIGISLGAVLNILLLLAKFNVKIIFFISLLINFYAIYVAYLLLKIKKNALINAKILLFIYFILYLVPPINPIGLFFNIIWILYFFNSKRVKVTYAQTNRNVIL